MRALERRPWIVVAVAVLGISIAAPLIRLSDAHPIAIAIWRLGFALVIIAAILLITGTWRQWARLKRHHTGIALGAGAMLALHFWSWNTSLGLTTVAASVVLVNTQPLIVALLSALWLGEAPDRRQWIGIAIAVAGAFVLVAGDLNVAAVAGRDALTGDLLALVGAVTAALYYLAGRRLRQMLDLWPYVGLVYSACLVTLVLIALAIGAPFLVQPPRELAIFAALALGPMMLGHTGFNWALRWLPAYVVTLATLGEPVGATLLAAVIPGIQEVPSLGTLIGGLIIVAGVVLAIRPSRERAG
jgi:drug/metabolite transporter (DMT)-like permease